MSKHIEDITIAVSNSTAKIGGGVSTVTGIAAYQDVIPLYVAIIGVIIAVLGYFTSLFFQIRKDRREHLIFLNKLKKQDDIELKE